MDYGIERFLVKLRDYYNVLKTTEQFDYRFGIIFCNFTCIFEIKNSKKIEFKIIYQNDENRLENDKNKQYIIENNILDFVRFNLLNNLNKDFDKSLGDKKKEYQDLIKGIFKIENFKNDILDENTCQICYSDLKYKTVKKEGKNKGRKFTKCLCGKFYWKDSTDYNSDKFKNNACRRCGYYNCKITYCERIFDWYGNLIPSTDDKNFNSIKQNKNPLV